MFFDTIKIEAPRRYDGVPAMTGKQPQSSCRLIVEEKEQRNGLTTACCRHFDR